MTQMTTTYDSTKTRLGICQIWYNGVHLGHTLGGVTLRITSKIAEKKVDKYGDAPVGVVDIGTEVQVTTKLAEESITTLAKLFPQSTVAGSSITFGKAVGTEITGYALWLIPTESTALPVVIYKAMPSAGETVEVEYSSTGQRVWPITWRGVPDDRRTEGDTLFRIGGDCSSSSCSCSCSSSSSSST